ncbi:MAG: ABC transporter permease, partial [Saprospiraceae bacterium]|nr:ABC transporter permease [Saprospiraceae bacterium]
MINTYLLTAWRSLRKNPGYAFLNIVGLAVGLSAGTLILLWVMDEWRYDRFHERLPQIHVLLQDQTSDGQIFTFQAMPGPLAGDLLREFPEIT